MKYYFRFILMIVLWGLCFGSLTTAQNTEDLQPGLAISIMTKRNEIFSEASRSSGKLATVELGDLVTVLQIDGEWAQVEFDNVVGWIRHAVGDINRFINVNGPTPPMRGYHAMTYDVESDRIVLFGGSMLPNTWFADTWSYHVSTNTWTRMAPTLSPPKGEGPLVYDVQSDRTIFFHGSSPALSNLPTETWAYDLNSDTWTNMEPSPAPPALLGARMVYDTESDRMILFGGLEPASVHSNFNYLNETWAYDYDTNTWMKMEPEISPPGMNYQPMAYDASVDRVLVIGSNATNITHETWVYDYNTDTWESRENNGGPDYRDYGAMVFAEVIGQVILFGEGEPILKNDTWTYDFDTNTWTELHPATSPSERGWHAMAYSSADDLIILFGGGKTRGSYTLETWVYNPNTITWTEAGP